MELTCGKPTYAFKHLAILPRQLLSFTHQIIQILAFTDTENWILIKLP